MSISERATVVPEAKDGAKLRAWWLRFIKGVIIAVAFILPGVSGSALAAILGVYERMVGFMANITRDFWENFLFFLPLGIGGVAGIIVLSAPLQFLLHNYKGIVMWGFAGCIVGSLPALYHEARAARRGLSEWIVLAVSLLGGTLLLWLIALRAVAPSGACWLEPTRFSTWLIGGGVIALGIIVPGLSSASLLIVLGIYDCMLQKFKSIDVVAFLLMGLGGLVTLLLLSKGTEFILRRFHAWSCHFILGIVTAATIVIVLPPIVVYSDFSWSHGVLATIMFAAGIFLGERMSRLGKNYKN